MSASVRTASCEGVNLRHSWPVCKCMVGTGPNASGFSRQPAIIGVPNSPSNSPPSLVPDACPSQQGFTYERRHPELQPLHKAVRIGWPLLQEQVAEHTAAALPKFVVKGFEA